MYASNLERLLFDLVEQSDASRSERSDMAKSLTRYAVTADCHKVERTTPRFSLTNRSHQPFLVSPPIVQDGPVTLR